MTLIRFVQRASILAGITFAGIAFHGSSANAQAEKFCVVTSNGKTTCGTLKAVERACVSTDNGVVCGKFKSVAAEQVQRQEEAPKPITGYRKEVDNFVLTLESCKRVAENVRCQLNILNKGKDRKVGLMAYGARVGEGSSLVDSTGKSYTATGADFGSGSNMSPESIMTTNNEVVLSISFSEIPDSAVKIQLLNLAFTSGIKPIQLRNVPILK
jgi:hypothetical protein